MPTDEQLYYMREVLGIREVLLPQEDTPQSKPLEFQGDPEGELLVFSGRPLNEGQKELVQKMTQAMKVSRSLWVNGKEDASDLKSAMEQALPELTISFGIVFGESSFKALFPENSFEDCLGTLQAFHGISFLVTHPLEAMLFSHADVKSVQQTKKKTWIHLQYLMQQINHH